jgi:hypothetical protein
MWVAGLIDAELFPLSLMIPLCMVMRNIFAQRPPQGALTKENELRQTLILHRSHPALSIGVQVRTSRRQRERLDLTRFDDRSEGDSALGIAIMQEIPTVSEGAASFHGHVPGDLLHPSLVRMNGNPGDVHLAALQMDEKQHVAGHQSSQREDLHVKKSVAARCARMNAAQVVVCLRSGAGGRP